MSSEPKRIETQHINRVLLNGHGWIKIESGSLYMRPLEFWYPAKDGEEQGIFSGLSFLGFTFTEFETGKIFTATTESILACEILGGE